MLDAPGGTASFRINQDSRAQRILRASLAIEATPLRDCQTCGGGGLAVLGRVPGKGGLLG